MHRCLVHASSRAQSSGNVPDKATMSLASESVTEVIGRLFSIVVSPCPNVGAPTPLMRILDGVFKRVKQCEIWLIQVTVRGTRKIVNTQGPHPKPTVENGKK